MKKFLKTLLPNFFKSFSGKFFVWHITAIFLTYITVLSGFDWWYFLHTRNFILDVISYPAIILGSLGVIILPFILLWIGKKRNHKKTTLLAWAIGQAALLGWIISSIYKAFTGRIQPNIQEIGTDISHQFNFGFLKHGIFWGWPSSHTTVAFAIAFTLITIFPENKKLKWGVLAAALFIGLGVSFSFHWFSEFIAGAIIGSAIGIVVGRSFKKYY
ncbi:PAP2 superfamily protein [uncultured archaeon]|nr:PAP2 superfamily protein [uncultured archaeon]